MSDDAPALKTVRTRLSRFLQSRLFVPLVLLGMTVAVFADVLFSPGDRILSKPGMDLAKQFAYWRQFGFTEMRAGHIPLWNPHVFSGAPFMGEFQNALFYPPNWIYLVLPLAKAIDCEIALHVFLMGLFTALWARRYRLHPMAVLFAGSVMMFSGVFFLHVYAGHLAQLDAMAWVPLILLSVDGLLDEPSSKWTFVGIFASAMQFLAGFPMVLFQTIVTAALYGPMRLTKAPRPLKTVFALVIVGACASAITAVQLWTGIQTTGEGTRSGGVTYAFAASFSLPPENFLTLLVPGFFGNLTGFPYWGRTFLWESSLFFGLTGLAMFLFGAGLRFPQKRIWSVMAAILLAIALGRHTPLFLLLYRYVPGFNLFRSSSQFSLEAILFLAMLAGFGTDAILRSAVGAKIAALALLIGALGLGAAGALLRTGASATINEAWNQSVGAIPESGESYSGFGYQDSGVLAAARQFAGAHCLISATILLLLAALFALRVFRPEAAYFLAIFGIVEALVFARSTVTSFSLATTVPKGVREFLAAHPGDYRTLQSNRAMAVGANDLWGYDPMVLRRYAEFVSYSQGNPDYDYANMEVHVHQVSPLFRLLRLRFAFTRRGDEYDAMELSAPLPHLLLLNDFVRISDRKEILNTLSASSFDPHRTAVLESAPDPAPVGGAPSGTVQLLGANTDSMTIAADIARPALLLITDTYSRYWRAVALSGSSQTRYQVMPADYTLMAVPLGAGRHLLRLEYAPSGYVIGRWISLAATIVYLVALGAFLRRRLLLRRASHPHPLREG